jgi:hypothetical protein
MLLRDKRAFAAHRGPLPIVSGLKNASSLRTSPKENPATAATAAGFLAPKLGIGLPAREPSLFAASDIALVAFAWVRSIPGA